MSKWRTNRRRSFRNAFSGIWYNLRNEPNFLIQISFAIAVVVIGLFFQVRRKDWIILLLLIGIVLATEVMNTAIEKICDRFMDESDPAVRVIKDSAAAAVLIVSISAAVIGCIVFWPYIRELLSV